MQTLHLAGGIVTLYDLYMAIVLGINQVMQMNDITCAYQ